MDKNDPLYEFYNDQLDYVDTEPRDTISIQQPEQLIEEYRKLLEKYNKLQTYCDTLHKTFSEMILYHERLMELVK